MRNNQLQTAQSEHLLRAALILVACLAAGCTKISLSPSSSTAGKMHQSTHGQRQLLPELPTSVEKKNGFPQETTPNQSEKTSTPSAPLSPVNLSGKWKIGFLYDTKNLTSTIDLTQSGNSFHGNGFDDLDKSPFLIEEGSIAGQQIKFRKNYSDGKSQPVEYSGTFQNVNDPNYSGPYMSGNYECLKGGKKIAGEWEGEIVTSSQAPAQAPANSAAEKVKATPSPPPEAQSLTRAPQLSGKWNVGFESDFKTIHSTMYLEQDGGALTGHGIDENTKEKFVIARGWYNFPRVTIVRRYTKGKGRAATSREVTFKATVTSVNAADYTGPYLSGKTQGGGAWEAQLMK
jgi:hypothetical protein